MPGIHLGDLRLNGTEYSIDLGSYRVRDIIDFAPRAATPGGSIVHSELGLYQPYMKTDWRHGLGFMWETDALGYLQTDGQVDTRHPGLAMLMTLAVNDSEATAAEGFTTVNTFDFNNAANDTDYTFSWGPDLRKRTIAGVWSSEPGLGGDTTVGFGTVNFVMQTQNYVYVCPDNARIVTILKSTGFPTVSGVNASSTDYRWLIAHQGFIYAGKDGTSNIYRDSSEALANLAGAVGDDPNVILMGGDLPTIGAISFLGKLFVTRQDGLFEIVGESLTAHRMLDFSNAISSANFRSIAVFNNKLVFAIRDVLYTWNGSTLVDITPQFLTDTFPYTTYGRFDNFVSAGRWLYMTARTNETTYEEHILAWDGVAFHKMAEPITNGTDTITAMGYDVLNNYLWYAVDATTDTVNFIEFQNQSEFPFARFPITGTHSLISARMHMGFRRVTKSTPSIFVDAENVTAARYLVVWYNIDGAGWLEWGGTGNGRITANGTTNLTNPVSGGTNSTIQYNYIQIRIDFVSDSATESPILEGWTLRFIMRPATLYGHAFQIIAAGGLKIGSTHRDLRSVRDIYSAVETARASTAPVTLVDPFGVSVQGYVSSVERRAIERHGRTNREGFPDIESVIVVNFVQVG
jgi:hypothetical protein